MHMADALISPAVGGTMWAVTAATIAYCGRKLKQDFDDRKVPLMGVLGAFIFAAQMINFSIPGTGSSGHLGGGMILAILLGPYAGFLTIASVVTVQALFFADGGLLALGCNIFNMGFFPCFIAFPLIYQKIARDNPNRKRILIGAILASVAALQVGAFGVVLETVTSGISSLPFSTFVLLMQPIHLAIGLVEGLVTAAVVTFIWQARPDLLPTTASLAPMQRRPYGKVLAGLAICAVLTAGCLSWFASSHPDGLEWAIRGVTGHEELAPPTDGVHGWLARLQEHLAFLPGYDFKPTEPVAAEAQPVETQQPAWPAVQTGTSVAGLVGGSVTLLLAAAIGLVLKRRGRVSSEQS